MIYELQLLVKLKEVRSERGGPSPPVDPFDFETHPTDLRFLTDVFLNVMLYNVPPAAKPKTSSMPMFDPSNSAPMSPMPPEESVNHPPPGLSKAAVDFITNGGKAAFAKSTVDLVQIKVGLGPLSIEARFK